MMHIYSVENQIVSETKLFCEMLKNVYKDLGFTDVKVKFSIDQSYELVMINLG